MKRAATAALTAAAIALGVTACTEAPASGTVIHKSTGTASHSRFYYLTVRTPEGKSVRFGTGHRTYDRCYIGSRWPTCKNTKR